MSNTLENISDEIFRAPETVAPLCVCCGCRLRGYNFVEGLALFFESCHLLASAGQKVTIKGELGLVTDGAVTRDDDHAGRDLRQVRFGRANHTVNAAAR